MVERPTVNRMVVGSSPAAAANRKETNDDKEKDCLCFRGI